MLKHPISSVLATLFHDHTISTQKVVSPLLFKATKDKSCIYLLGTRHTLSLSALPQCVIDCINMSQVLCCESLKTTDEEIQAFLSLDPFDESTNNRWYDLLLEDGKQHIEQYLVPFIAQWLPGKNARQLKPEWLMLALSCASHTNSMDKNIADIFIVSQKPMHALDKPLNRESFVQLNQCVSLNPREIANPPILNEAICSFFKTISDNTDYITNSVKENLERLEIGAFIDPRLLADRNEEWIEKLNTIVPQQECLFIAVGAAHLVNDIGLLTWLQESGYTLETVNSENQFEPFDYNPKKSPCCIQ